MLKSVNYNTKLNQVEPVFDVVRQVWYFIIERGRPFILQRALPLEKVQRKRLKGAPRPRLGATEAMASLVCM